MESAIYQLATGFCLVLYAAASPCAFPIMAANAAEPVGSNRLVDKLLVTGLTWHQGDGLLYGEATIVNRNPHSVSQVIITCEMLDERGNQIGSKEHRPTDALSTRRNQCQRHRVSDDGS